MKLSCRIYIPEIGDKLILASPWTFPLFYESRNIALIHVFGLEAHLSLAPRADGSDSMRVKQENRMRQTGYGSYHYQILYKGVARTQQKGNYFTNDAFPLENVTLPTGTGLTVDRIHIRKGKKNFSSVSFILDRETVKHKLNVPARKKVRFWAKLADVNTMKVKCGETK